MNTVTEVSGWRIEEYEWEPSINASTGGRSFAIARPPSGDRLGARNIDDVEFDGLRLEFSFDAPYDGVSYPSIPMPVILALVEIHNRRMANLGTGHELLIANVCNSSVT
jgi:hypothetical protein